LPSQKGVKAIIEYEGCPLESLLSPEDIDSEKGDRPLRILVLRVDRIDGRLHVWLKISGSKNLVRDILQNIAVKKSTYYSIIGESLDGKLVYLTFPNNGCGGREHYCPLANPSPRVYPLSTVVVEGKMRSLVVASSRKHLEELARQGFRVEVLESGDDHQYHLTPKQEEVLLRAFLQGYYSYPRRVDLKDLASSLGLSPSTVAELLRKAEIKIIRRFLLEELFIAYSKTKSSKG